MKKNFSILFFAFALFLGGCVEKEDLSTSTYHPIPSSLEIPSRPPDIRGIITSVFENGVNIAPRFSNALDRKNFGLPDRKSAQESLRQMKEEDRKKLRNQLLAQVNETQSILFSEETDFFKGFPWEEYETIKKEEISPQSRINIWLNEQGQATTIFISPFNP